MKVLDSQAALLTTAEVHQFLQSSKTRPSDKKIGSYASVNLNNYHLVRQDLSTYIQGTAPFILSEPPSELWMTDLLSKLKKYQLHKPEVFALINLGIGRHQKESTEPENEDPSTEPNGEAAEGEEVERGGEDGEGNGDGGEEGAEEEEGQDNVDVMLFELIVEDSDERFPGEQGQKQISEIIGIIKNTIVMAHHKTNGSTTNGT